MPALISNLINNTIRLERAFTYFVKFGLILQNKIANPLTSLTSSTQIILGIDPGTVVMGYGVIAIENRKIKLISMGVVKLNKLEDSLLRLKMISEKVTGLIQQYQPNATAIEAPFFGKNVQSMLKLGRAQGVCIAASW
jgi:crossover junction endodeoxyribonuclease RuvC